MGSDVNLTCRLCGHKHRPIRLAPGERALCARCSTVMATEGRFGPEAALVFSITGLILALPAALLPFVIAGKLGDERVCRLFTGVGALWDNGMRTLAVLVFLCGALLPVALLGAMAVLHVPACLKWHTVNIPSLPRIVHILEHWAFPEVQVLAVLIALIKLGGLVDLTVGPGFWCYCAMAVSLVLAQRSFNSELCDPAPVPCRTDAAP
jgi:paraquat-inducible protein A